MTTAPDDPWPGTPMTRSAHRSPLSSVASTAAPNCSVGLGVPSPNVAPVSCCPPPRVKRTSTPPPWEWRVGIPTTTSGTPSPSRSPTAGMSVLSQPATAPARPWGAAADADAATGPPADPSSSAAVITTRAVATPWRAGLRDRAGTRTSGLPSSAMLT